MFQLTDLPDTLFLDIISHLSPREIILHRLVSRASHAALTRTDFSRTLLHIFFPRSLECRELKSQIAAENQKQSSSGACNGSPEADWPSIFASVSRRYHNLSAGSYHILETIPILKDAKLMYPFTPWNRHLQRDEMSMPLQLPDRSWTYDDGILVYPRPSSNPVPSIFKALDLFSGLETTIPFACTFKIVRRLRLCHSVLIIEWAEAEGSHPLNDLDIAHRHFATAFTVHRTSSPLISTSSSPPEVTFRSEWKIHYLGLPLTPSDRLVSTHNATHYALYAHQPTRSPWGEDTPLERLVVWSLGRPSSYRPSLDPSSSRKPDPDPGPAVILRLTNGDLDHWHVRQRDTPRLMSIALDAGHVFLQEEDHLWTGGPQSSETPPARHSVRSTGIPLSRCGPRWVDECGAEGDAERSFCPARGASDASPGRAPCWRHEEFPYLTVAQVVDAAAGTRVCGRRCFAMETVSASGAGGGDGRGEVQFPDDMWRAVMSGAALAGDERWVIGEDGAGDVSVVRF
ncbi:hypothetical protein CkaCkLH20_02722 [Colletotrichum karsti]|uniref:F-box domain-containing protein n=1 Tax=Colletotrichum karsti TaxID=1095194 RepID=A0A9P6IDL6_9PEZI|nr:uncharacterized protein CkaCkLH20_02722 [Colletotrichum karsti]KAF9879911.1 hypothetical protein CkaCkLH20_02722 [Colletotrichum karsti]